MEKVYVNASKRKMGTEYAVKLAGNRESKINVCLLQGTKAQCHNV